MVGAVPDFPEGTGMDRRMSIIRLADGRLVFHNAVPIDDATLAKLTAWGKPSILIVPMHLHAIDAPAFREKLGLKVFTSKTTPPLFKLWAVNDKAALARDLRRLADTPGLARLVPSHGLIVDVDPAAALRRVAS